MATIGTLALQGGFAAHCAALEELGHRAIEVRTAADLEVVDGLILPGGESTTQLRLLERFELERPLLAFAGSGRPIFATCAGLILFARTVTHPAQKSYGLIDVGVARNAYGRQVDSFEAFDDRGDLPLIFIRAPRITAIGSGVEVLATREREPILVRQANIVGATFHPELTRDRRVHRMVFGEGRHSRTN
jgi:pyridoxal 5'-phosphate synthase pdxT subunit